MLLRYCRKENTLNNFRFLFEIAFLPLFIDTTRDVYSIFHFLACQCLVTNILFHMLKVFYISQIDHCDSFIRNTVIALLAIPIPSQHYFFLKGTVFHYSISNKFITVSFVLRSY